MKQVVWCISKYALPPKHGAQGRLFYISEELNKLGFDSTVITSSTNHLVQLPAQHETFKLTEEGLGKALFIRGLKFNNSQSKRRILSWFVFEWHLFRFLFFSYHKYLPKPDVVFVSSMSLLTIVNGLFAKNIYKCKLIFEVRDIWPLSAILVAGYSRFNPFILFLRYIEKLGYKYSDIIVSPLPNANAHIERSINRKVNFVHLPQGFDFSLSLNKERLDEDFVLKYIPKDKFIFGYIGNLVNAYDLESLIKCARLIEVRNQRVHFLILGDGTHKEYLEKISSDLTNITFIPRIPKAKIQHFLSFCDVATNFLRPEPLFEFGVSPQKLIDYMLAGKPILMSYSGYKTLVEDINCGLVIEAANIEKIVNAMMYLSSLTKEELNVMGNNGRNYLRENLNWEYLIKQKINLFAKL